MIIRWNQSIPSPVGRSSNLQFLQEVLSFFIYLFVCLFVFFQELDQRHNAVLQMYGEKAEECEELKMDLEDVKSMYKTQVQKL